MHLVEIVPTILLVCSTLTGALVTALYVLQEKLLYHPSIPSRLYERYPGDFNLPSIEVDLVTDDDVKLHAWLITQTESKSAATMIYFHGNAGNISHRLPDVRFSHASGFNILMVSYRGYGKSQGSPSEKGLRLDAVAALRYVCDRDDIIDQSRIYLFGRSIGAACAISLAANAVLSTAVRGLIVENSFTSIDDMIDVVMPFLKFAKRLNRNKWNSLSEIAKVKVPILFISGLVDELVPPHHMVALRENAMKAPFTCLHTVEMGGHNDTWWVGGAPYRTAMIDFIDRVESEE